MKYSIVIPTYNHCDDLLKPCVESLLKYSIVTDIELIIVANGCVDNTMDYFIDLRKKFDYLGLHDNLKLVWNDNPLGYSRATNKGIELSTTNLIVLLNNDCVFLEQSKNLWLQLLENQFIQDNRCGISCVIKNYSQPAGKEFAVFFLVMIHRKVFNTIGLLNTEYGVGGGEDTEFCIEAEKAGYTVCLANTPTFSVEESMYTGNFPVYHKGEGTVHDKNLVPEWDKIFDENSLRLAKKYNIPYYKWAVSNNTERGVFCKGDGIYSRESLHYYFAGQNLYGTKILEIGCSTGYGLQFLPQGIEYTGIDYYHEIIDLAKNQHWREGIRFIDIDINNFELGQYDTILMFQTLEHIENGLELVERLKKHTKKLIISVTYNEDPSRSNIHHKIHNITEHHFKDFTIHGLVDINGNLVPIGNSGSNTDYTLLASWQDHDTKEDRNNLLFLKNQNIEIYREILEENIYHLSREHIQDRYVLDVGANIGIFSLFASQLGARQVFAIEPVTQTFYQLCRNINISNYKNIIPLKNIVTHKAQGFMNIGLEQNNGHNSVYSVTENYETVHTITLAELLSRCEGNNVVLKLDCEGSEYDIIMNATHEDMSRIDRIMVEVHGNIHPLYKGFDVLGDKLRSFGFLLEDIEQIFSWENTETGERINWQQEPDRVEIWKR